MDLTTAPNLFTSNLAESVFGANPQYNAVQFHFHAGSEHTIDGKRHDFEMHTVHLAQEEKSGFKYAAVGIIFSVNDYTARLTAAEQAIIDSFFESLDLESNEDPVVSMINYGHLLQMIDTNNRYVYKGSVTTPPCAQYVYWNVMTTIYPISQKHLDLFKKQLERGEAGKLAQYGNYRVTTPVDQHNVIRVADNTFGNELKASAQDATYNININIYNQGSKGSMCY